MTAPSLLFPSTSSTPAAPQGGLLFGGLAEQSPLTETTSVVPQHREACGTDAPHQEGQNRPPRNTALRATLRPPRPHSFFLVSSVVSVQTQQTRVADTCVCAARPLSQAGALALSHSAALASLSCGVVRTVARSSTRFSSQARWSQPMSSCGLKTRALLSTLEYVAFFRFSVGLGAMVQCTFASCVLSSA